MEAFLNAKGRRAADAATQKAQQIMYDAWDTSTSRTRVAMAKKALATSPLCADAFVLLAYSADTVEVAHDYFARGVDAGELALGPDKFKEYEGSFWGFLETRPYMRAKAGLAGTYFRMGNMVQAISYYRDILRFNPDDNQGVRYTLLGCYLREDDAAAASELLEDFAGEGSAFWLYTRMLMAFRSGAMTDRQVKALVKDALSSNQHVPDILAGMKPAVPPHPAYLSMGGPDEATYYVQECGRVWYRTPGAVAWLVAATDADKPKWRNSTVLHWMLAWRFCLTAVMPFIAVI
jgi:tetratricopeptide (TPR) repeat protein